MLLYMDKRMSVTLLEKNKQIPFLPGAGELFSLQDITIIITFSC